MIRFLFCSTLVLTSFTGFAQSYGPSEIFAHNDYVQSNPFHAAYGHGVGYIEADIFLSGDDLLVAHAITEIDKSKTLEKLYLLPLQEKIRENEGRVYPDPGKTLMLMIDLKSEGVATLNKLMEKLKLFSALTSCKNLFITISGSVPDPVLWKNYPDYIHFDGRPGIAYTTEQLQRIIMISTSFKSVSKWNGNGLLPREDEEKILSLTKETHVLGKKMRFWATPDNENSWAIQTRLKMDMIVTDDVPRLSDFIKKKK